MSKPISLFNEYTKIENRVSNYVGLLLKMLYNEKPEAFQKLIESIVEEKQITIGPIFEQQKTASSSCPDISIKQSGFEIYVETKLNEKFEKEQINRHLESIKDSNSSTKVLFLLGKYERDNYQEQFNDSVEEARKSDIVLQAISFEDLIDSISTIQTSSSFKELLSDFVDFADRMDLFPKWKYLLDVVNCASSKEEVINANYYACYDTGGNYHHNRAKYFGVYKDKEVSHIHEIIAVLRINTSMESIDVKWNNSDKEEIEIVEIAKKNMDESDTLTIDNKTFPIQMFILDDACETSFIKRSPRGPQWSRKYFWDIAKDISNAKELAEKLNKHSWKEFDI